MMNNAAELEMKIFVNNKYSIWTIPLNYLLLQVSLGHWLFLDVSKEDEIDNGYRYRTYWYGPLSIEIEEKI